jgi:hypothetical protein
MFTGIVIAVVLIVAWFNRERIREWFSRQDADL